MEISLSENNLILVGLPHSGKTTFVAALWHFVESGEIDSSLQITSLPEDRSYLNALRSKWLDCVPFERTKVDAKHEVRLNIRDIKKGVESVLLFPDVSGEMYRLQFESRSLDLGYIEQLYKSKGIILFVNPDDLKKPILISDTFNLNLQEEESNVVEKIWEHKDAPTQVMLVDIVQMLNDFINKSYKIAVIVSAWDLITHSPDDNYSRQSPAQFVKKELPLFYQFVETNKDKFDVRFFGISAQGGDYESSKTQLQNEMNQSQRIKVYMADRIVNDICQPIKWLLDE